MSWSTIAAFLSFVVAASAMHQPVYKIILTQKNFPQFLQYNVETPPIRQFTCCMWLKFYNIEKEQTIFSYTVSSHHTGVIRLWLDSGGRFINLSFNDGPVSSALVELTKDTWRHLCISYQSDYGAWALYLDSRLIACEASQNLLGYVIPKGGSIIIGNGVPEIGTSQGLEGEIFGVNMILSSTIERNHTMKNHPKFAQKLFRKNVIKGPITTKYVVLKDLLTQEMQNVAKTTFLSPLINKSHIKVSTPYTFLEHTVGTHQLAIEASPINDTDEMETSYLVTDKITLPVKDVGKAIWNVVNDPQRDETRDPTRSSPSFSASHDFPPSDLEIEKPPSTEPKPVLSTNSYTMTTKSYDVDEISEIELPPPLQTDNKVYGQWTSSRLAGSVLNYLKSINFHHKERKIPVTIPLFKVSDSYPYPSDFNNNVVRPPTNIRKKNLETHPHAHSQYTGIKLPISKHHNVAKREAKLPEINVKILDNGNDVRDEIIKSHAQAQPRNVEIINRGESSRWRKEKNKKNKERLQLEPDLSEYERQYIAPKSTGKITTSSAKPDDMKSYFNLHESKSLFNVLPFLKSVNYFTEDNEVENTNDMYSTTFSSTDKWHSIKTYNDDLTPRAIPVTIDGKRDADLIFDRINKKSLAQVKNKSENNKVHNHGDTNLFKKSESHKLNNHEDENIFKGKEIAMDTFTKSIKNKDKISIIKYNQDPNVYYKKNNIKENESIISHLTQSNRKNKFNENVKIGNALNEKYIIGHNEEQKKLSFVGGDEKVPDIHKYRSDIDNEKENLFPSLKPKVCKNVELFDNYLYVHNDGSIDLTHLSSPIKNKNIGVDFILQNYKKCSLKYSLLEDSALLLIDWNNTPVRPFGAPVLKLTKDPCRLF